jgi:hypothetical protein
LSHTHLQTILQLDTLAAGPALIENNAGPALKNRFIQQPNNSNECVNRWQSDFAHQLLLIFNDLP